MKTKNRVKNLLTTLLFTGLGFQASLVQADEVVKVEKQLLSSLSAINSLELDKALSNVTDLQQHNPKYKLAQLLTADLMAAKAGQFKLVKQVHQNHAKSVNTLLDEAEVRWQFSKESLNHSTGFDDFVLKSAQQNLILVSLQESRLYLYDKNDKGQMVRVADYYVTMGKKGSGKQREGDQRTPIGVYHLVDLLPGNTLPDLYGVGALPLNYPNIWDKSHGKTGSGIWLHGVPSNTYTRAPKASRGCVALNNKAMKRLLSEYSMPYSTPVVIVDQKQAPLGVSQTKESLLADVKTWLQDNHEKVDWQKVSVFKYPNEKNLYYITFPGKVENTLTQQFWQRDPDGDWKVVVQSEGSIQVASK
ncbi:murein L,D-transpeptidase family protein [Thiomicrorhabdus sp. Milos-T2]|uniref:L,D-transpeptidase family protein n=1 Tax=Thiomicrorhabdus sp. Milos-T2 TaxID=90814 RepID=UPI001319F962|nr:L,D-transpeptidase family protein [Thiomicrorhabdus sp. Milos-T2]